MRFAITKQGKIVSITSQLCQQRDCKIIEIPPTLDNVTSKDLILYGRVKDDKIVHPDLKKPVSQMKMAIVSNWHAVCGLSTYMEHLAPEITKHVAHFKLFIETNEAPLGNVLQMGDQIVGEDQVVSCWKRGQQLQKLIMSIKEYEPDIILINHEWGIFPNAAYFLSMLSQLSPYRVIVIMHSIFHHQDKTIVEAAIPEIVVHLDGARDVLKNEKHISGKVYVIPHGCFPIKSKDRLWNIYKSQHTFIQFGFGHRYKNFAHSIQATALLKDKFPDVFFTALFSESPQDNGAHQLYYNELMELIDKLGVQQNVAIIRGFQSDETLNSYLRTNKVAVFPYASQPGHEVFGATGAARLAMATNMPVITSSIPHFSDVESIKANSPEEMARQLETLFTDEVAVKKQLDLQEAYIADNTWEKTALRFVEILGR